jgi:signal peptidase
VIDAMAIDASAVHASPGLISSRTRHEIVAQRQRRSPTRRAGRFAARVLYAVVVVALAGVVVGEGAGYRLLAIRSGSMTPALEVGDMVITRSVPPSAVAAGDVITFRNAHLGQRLVTHRVLSAHRHGGKVDFVTKGDANPVSERWSIPVSGRVGRQIVAFPHLGRVADATPPLLAIAGIFLAALALSMFVLRRIWASAGSHAGST